MKIVFAASECVPFAKTGGLADVAGALPKVLAARGHDVTVILPRYKKIEAGKTAFASLTVPLGRELRFPAITNGRALDAVRYYFVDYPAYFNREGLYQEKGADYPDNAQRFALYSKAVLEFLKHAGPPDLVHCHDWQSALIPVLLKTQYSGDPVLARVPVVFTIHNLGYQGLFPPDTCERIGIPWELFNLEGLEFYGQLNFLKGGLVFSDFLTTVSRKYAEEIQTPEYGCGLEGVIRSRATTLAGILNGVDYAEWSPQSDKLIAARYSAGEMGGKAVCKKNLLEIFKLPGNNLKKPLIGIVSRFTAQKGFDLIANVADALLQNDLYIVALGTGEPEYEQLFRDLQQRFPHKVGVQVAYDNTVAHKIEAGADMFLMPSRYEPCGLNQIYSLKYGTVPVVRATGGLDDTIQPFDAATGKGTGFKFAAYSGTALLDCLQQALHVYATNPRGWAQLMKNGMEKDFSWNASAAEYEKVYQRVAARGGGRA